MSIENVNLAKQAYETKTNTEGNTLGYNQVQLSYEDGILTFTEDDGDVHQVEVAGLTAEEIDQLTKDLNVVGADRVVLNQAVNDAKEADEVAPVIDPKFDADIEEAKGKLEALQGEWDLLNEQAETLKVNIEQVSGEIKKEISELLEQQDELVEEEKKRVEEVLAEQIEQFKKDRQNGKDVTLESLQGDISTALADSGFEEGMASLMTQFVVTNTKIRVMDTLLSQLGDINSQMEGLSADIAEADAILSDAELAKATAEAEAAAKEAEETKPEETSTVKKGCCDPIGFEENGVKYEFVIDKDGNGELSNFSEFLGSKDNFDEMMRLDTDGENGVTKDELEAAGVKVLVTDADGNQVMKSLDEAFGGKDINIDTDNFRQAEAGTKAGNGEELLGNFDIKIGDEVKEGYSTLDSAEYLENNYKFTDENPDNMGIKTGSAVPAAPGVAIEDVEFEHDGDVLGEQRVAAQDDNAAFIDIYTDTLETYEDQMTQVEKILGFDEDIVENVRKYAEETGTYIGKKTIKKAEKAAEEKMEAKKAEQAKEEEKADENAKVEGENLGDVKIPEGEEPVDLGDVNADVGENVGADVNADFDPELDLDEIE